VEIVETESGEYRLKHGAHRFHASVAAGFSHIPAIVCAAVNSPRLRQAPFLLAGSSASGNAALPLMIASLLSARCSRSGPNPRSVFRWISPCSASSRLGRQSTGYLVPIRCLQFHDLR
jgi:hypothetical protein